MSAGVGARVMVLALAVTAAWSYAVEPSPELRIGVVESPPFVVRNEDGTLTGISVELWRQVANALDLKYAFKTIDSWGAIVEDTANGSLDVAVAPLSITAQREVAVDFSHAYHNTGISVAVRQDFRRGHAHALWRVLSSRFLHIVGALALLLFAIGSLMWFLERKRNPEHFGGGAPGGIGAAFWWAAVTMTTVGFGDKVPKTVAGRMLGVIWMFSGIILISSFTAAITSALTISHMEGLIQKSEDLATVRLGAVTDSASEEFLLGMGLHPRRYAGLEASLDALAKREVQAVVADEPLLRHLILKEYPGELEVLSLELQREDYGFAFPPESPLREPVNQVILEITRRPDWNELLQRYMGPDI